MIRMAMINTSSIKNRIKELTQGRGFAPHEIQISKSSIKFIAQLVNKDVEDLINKCLDYIIDHNKKHNYKQLKRITPLIMKNALFTNLTTEQVLYLTSLQQKPKNNNTSENDAPLSSVNEGKKLTNHIVPNKSLPKNAASGGA